MSELIEAGLFIMLWLFSGFLGFMLFIVYDMRGTRFNKDYFFKFTHTDIFYITVVILAGAISFVVILISMVLFSATDKLDPAYYNAKKTDAHGFSFTYLCYEIANIGLKSRQT